MAKRKVVTKVEPVVEVNEKEIVKMGKVKSGSMYMDALVENAKTLKAFAQGEVTEVSLTEFDALSKEKANGNGRNRKVWTDKGEVTGCGVYVPGTTRGITNCHTQVVGEALFALGYKGLFFISKDLRLTKVKIAAEVVIHKTVQDIITAANA